MHFPWPAATINTTSSLDVEDNDDSDPTSTGSLWCNLSNLCATRFWDASRCAYREFRPYQPTSLWHANRRSRGCTFLFGKTHPSLKAGSLCLVQASSASRCREFLSRKNPV